MCLAFIWSSQPPSHGYDASSQTKTFWCRIWLHSCTFDANGSEWSASIEMQMFAAVPAMCCHDVVAIFLLFLIIVVLVAESSSYLRRTKCTIWKQVLSYLPPFLLRSHCIRLNSCWGTTVLGHCGADSNKAVNAFVLYKHSASSEKVWCFHKHLASDLCRILSKSSPFDICKKMLTVPAPSEFVFSSA